MFRALYTAATGMVAQQLNLDNVANNLSNASTAGFRRRRLQFQDLMYQNLVMPGSAATQNTTVTAGLQVGLGTRTAASEVIPLQGDFNQTGNVLDLAIQGMGFFQVKMPSGETGYTRAGMFHLDNQGNVVTADGNPLDPAITIPPDALTVTTGSDGSTGSNGNLANLSALAKQAVSNGMTPTDAYRNLVFQVGSSVSDGTTELDASNTMLQQLQQQQASVSGVSLDEEASNLLLYQRAYQAAAQAISAVDQMLQTVINMGANG